MPMARLESYCHALRTYGWEQLLDSDMWKSPDGEFWDSQVIAQAMTDIENGKLRWSDFVRKHVVPGGLGGAIGGMIATTTGGTSQQQYWDGYLQQEMQRQSEYLRQMATPQLKVECPQPSPLPESFGKPQTALAWLDSELDRIRVRL